jgi:hypothetical protein
MRGLTCRRTEVEVRRRYLGAELVRAQVGGCLPASSQLYRILRVSPGFLRRTRDPPVLYDRACSAVAYVTGDADQGTRLDSYRKPTRSVRFAHESWFTIAGWSEGAPADAFQVTE